MDGLIRSAQLSSVTSGHRTGGWRVSTRLPLKPYQPILKDVYPRNEYTKMHTFSGPKYYTGQFLTYDYKDAPQISATDSSSDRPVVFKPRTIERVQTRKKYGENLKGYSSVPLHLCNDTSSLLYQRSLQPNYGDVKRPESQKSFSDMDDLRSSISRYPYALHISPRHVGREESPTGNYSYTKTWVNTAYPTVHRHGRRLNVGIKPATVGVNGRDVKWTDREERLAKIQNAPEWYSEFFPRQKVADAIKFMGKPKPQNQTGRGKEIDVNFNGK